MSNKVFFGIIIVLIVGVLGGSIYFANRDEPKTEEAVTTDLKAVTEADHVKGPKDAKITLIEYGDFQCPFCGSVHPTIEEVLAEYENDVRFVFRHFPIPGSHPNALVAHRAAEAAGNQDKFFEMHDLLYENQQEWSSSNKPFDIFKKYAKQIDLDVDTFTSDFDSDEVADAVRIVKEAGTESGISSTPSFFLNGKKIDIPRSADELKQDIDKELESTK